MPVQAWCPRAFLQGITKYRVIPGSGCFREQLPDDQQAAAFLTFPQSKLSHPAWTSRCKSGQLPAAASDGQPPDDATS